MLFDSDWNKNHRQIPMHVNDLRTLRTLAGMPDMPPRPANHHHPVADAQWARLAHEHISRRLPTKYLSRETCLHPECSRDYDDNDGEGWRVYDDSVPVVVTTLELLAEHGPLGPIWRRPGRPGRHCLTEALENRKAARAVPIPIGRRGLSARTATRFCGFSGRSVGLSRSCPNARPCRVAA